MKKYVDLHTHSTHSDGSWTPTEIVQRAKKYELSAIAITDHDTVSGIPEGMAEAAKNGIDYVPGIEISTHWCEGRMHILGYFIDYTSSAIAELMKKIQEARKARVFDTCARLKEIDIDLPTELVFEIAHSADSIGRPHIANAMVKLGYVPTLQAAFNKYLAFGRPGYVMRWAPSPEDAIDIIHKTGGIAVLAHCAVTEGCMKHIDKIRAMGIDGVEVFYPSHKPHQIEFLKKFAKDNNLVVTGGSDCHGTVRGEPLLGIYKVPFSVYENLCECYKQKSDI